jgi:hypothetical protein
MGTIECGEGRLVKGIMEGGIWDFGGVSDSGFQTKNDTHPVQGPRFDGVIVT